MLVNWAVVITIGLLAAYRAASEPAIVFAPSEALVAPNPPKGTTFVLNEGTTLKLDDTAELKLEKVGTTVTLAVGASRATLGLCHEGKGDCVAWLSAFRCELADIRGQAAYLQLDRITNQVAATEKLQIRRGETVRLHKRVDFEFVGHSHKKTFPGQDSPLLVHVDYHRGPGSQATYHLYPPQQNTWSWQDLRFLLDNYDYNDSIDIVVHRMLLSPIK
jgi:hypothetical protein